MTLRVGLALALAACGTDSIPRTPDAPPGPFDLAPQCTSGVHWKMGDQRSPFMYPGRACNECHVEHIGTPRFHIAGTVYATGHEPDNCNGATGAIVEITDANGAVVSLESNAAGNFMILITETVAFPIHARVIAGTEIRAMTGAVASGDCNLCHTQAGTSDAPGRIVLP